MAFVDGNAGTIRIPTEASLPFTYTVTALTGLVAGDYIFVYFNVNYFPGPIVITADDPNWIDLGSGSVGSTNSYTWGAFQSAVGSGPYTFSVVSGGGTAGTVGHTSEANSGLSGNHDTTQFSAGVNTSAYTSAYANTLHICCGFGNDPITLDAALTSRENSGPNPITAQESAEGDEILVSTTVPARAVNNTNVVATITFEIAASPAAVAYDFWG